jgi:hypothetical protein
MGSPHGLALTSLATQWGSAHYENVCPCVPSKVCILPSHCCLYASRTAVLAYRGGEKGHLAEEATNKNMDMPRSSLVTLKGELN